MGSMILLLTAHLQAQPKDIHKDDSRSLKLSQLISLADANENDVDDMLDDNEFNFFNSNGDANLVKYNYVNRNSFILTRYIAKKRIIYTADYYTDGLKSKYDDQIKDLKLVKEGAEIIDNGIKTTYKTADDKWRIVFTKSVSDDKTSLTITIVPK